MVSKAAINASRLVLGGLTVLALGSGMAIIGMGYEIKHKTPFEAVQVVLIIIGALVLLAQISALLTMFLVRQLLVIYGVLEGLSVLSSVIVVICVKLRESAVINSVAKLPAEGSAPPTAADLEAIALRHHTHTTLHWGVPIIIVSIILQVAVAVLVAVTWWLASNEGTLEERKARREAERAVRVEKLKTDVQMTARANMYNTNKHESEVLRAHMEKTYGAYTHGDAWKKEERKKWFGIF